MTTKGEYRLEHLREGGWERLPGLFRFRESAAFMDHGGVTGSDCVSRASYTGADSTGEPLYRVYVWLEPQVGSRAPDVPRSRRSGVIPR